MKDKGTDNTMAKFKRRTKGRTTQGTKTNLNEGQRDTMAKFNRRTKGRTTQWQNLNGQRDGQHNGQI